jgi:hypothetical protein
MNYQHSLLAVFLPARTQNDRIELRTLISPIAFQ